MDSGGKVTEQGYVIALQYSFNEIEDLNKEIELLNTLIRIVAEMEKNNMLVVECTAHVAHFKAYKGALMKLLHFRKNTLKVPRRGQKKKA